MTAKFDVLAKYDFSAPKEMHVSSFFPTLHFKNSRLVRFNRVEKEIGLGYAIRKCLVDTGHAKGQEIHIITDTGVIFVFNKGTKNLVTIMVARPKQIKRYYAPFGEEAPELLLKKAYNNTAIKNLNND